MMMVMMMTIESEMVTKYFCEISIMIKNGNLFLIQVIKSNKIQNTFKKVTGNSIHIFSFERL